MQNDELPGQARDKRKLTQENGVSFFTQDLEDLADGVGTVDTVLLDVHKIVQKITSHQAVGLEAEYLQNILAELRDQADMKKIFGIVIDRAVLSKMFVSHKHPPSLSLLSVIMVHVASTLLFIGTMT
jgi:hypothetical protein